MPGINYFMHNTKTKCNSSRISYKRLLTGFTIVELLVVIAIIGLLASLILVQTRSARSRARDAEREAEIKSLQNALALYATNNRLYPVYSGPITGSDTLSTELVNKEALTQVPFDPLNIDPPDAPDYRYTYDSSDGSTYTLTYWLETNSISGRSAGQQTANP